MRQEEAGLSQAQSEELVTAQRNPIPKKTESQELNSQKQQRLVFGKTLSMNLN